MEQALGEQIGTAQSERDGVCVGICSQQMNALRGPMQENFQSEDCDLGAEGRCHCAYRACSARGCRAGIAGMLRQLVRASRYLCCGHPSSLEQRGETADESRVRELAGHRKISGLKVSGLLLPQPVRMSCPHRASPIGRLCYLRRPSYHQQGTRMMV